MNIIVFRFLLMTSFIDSLAASEKTAVVIDIGYAYTKWVNWDF